MFKNFLNMAIDALKAFLSGLKFVCTFTVGTANEVEKAVEKAKEKVEEK